MMMCRYHMDRVDFSSLQTHHMKQLSWRNTGRRWLKLVMPPELHIQASNIGDTELETQLCTADDGCCARIAISFVNVAGSEYLCCDQHTQECFEQTRGLPTNLWFCRDLVPNKLDVDERCFYTLVMKTSETSELQEKVGKLSWLWYPSERGVYVLSHEPNDDIELPDNVSWQPITRKEMSMLLAQIATEWAMNGKTMISFGFAPEYPFDRPDFTHTYSFKHVLCDRCGETYVEPYPLKYDARIDSNEDGEADVFEEATKFVVNYLTGTIMATE